MKEIKLTQGKVAIVDDDMFDELSQYNWQAVKGPRDHTFYAKRGFFIDGKCKSQLMHRYIMQAKNGFVVDHVNKNGLDNQRGNLRICTQQKNTFNSTASTGKTSEFLGVYLFVRQNKNSVYRKWKASIKKDGVSIRLGSYDSEMAAALAYDAKAIELFGEFANPNFKS